MQADQVTTGQIIHAISGVVVATGVSAEEYMEKYAADFCEWVGSPNCPAPPPLPA